MRTRLVVAALAVAIAGCGSSDEDSQVGAFGDTGVENGGVATLGAGEVRTWTELDASGAPAKVGITIDTATLDEADRSLNTYVELPEAARRQTVFDHVAINYRHHGHGPESIYDVPHFDIHLYAIDPAKRMAVDCTDEPMPDASRIPEPYFIPGTQPEPAGTCTPGMGVHALDPRSPELDSDDPQPFTHTLILGYHDGQFAFLEPMVTQELLRERGEFDYDLNPPAAGLDGRLWPTRVYGTYDAAAEAYHFVLERLVATE
ncbi:MAG: hypothetical protein JRI23_02520 [Deltaproteobacteria bacterium]|jgi:hypothetical protein|nr:hypothetical protein [Deltaproteobacteria bacterium]MBW2530369.1 hypothetical protein [Deltaproteobacteria bacterium]